MNLPQVVTDLIKAQNEFDAVGYANLFSETGVVSDEGKTHTGRPEIEHWIDHSNKNYQSVMQPLGYTENGTAGILTAACSGTFPGSPITLQFHFVVEDGQIQQLKVTN